MQRLLLVIVLLTFFTGCTISPNNNDNQKVEVEVSEELVTETPEPESSEENATEEKFVAEYRKIDAEKAKEMMNENSIILDVRTQEEFDEGHIQDAVLLPYDQIVEGVLTGLEDKNQVILVYCRSGRRSEIAARALVDEGYTQVYDFGGIIDWPYEIVK